MLDVFEVIRIIFCALIALFVLVTIHEFGHYWVARRCGVKVLRFSIGFGPIILRKQIGDTEFAFSALPLGGYVKMFGEHTQENETGEQPMLSESDKKISYSHKTVWQRMAIVLAGPIANFILAVVVYCLIFMGGTRGLMPLVGDIEPNSIADKAGMMAGAEILSVDGQRTETWSDVYDAMIRRIGDTGDIVLNWSPAESSSEQLSYLKITRWQSDEEIPNVLGSLGIEPFTPIVDAVIETVEEGSAADRAGLLPGDRILQTDGTDTSLWNDWTEIVRASPGRELSLLVERESVGQLVLSLTPDYKAGDLGVEIGFAGVSPVPPEWDESLIRKKSYSPVAAVSAAIYRTGDMSLFILDTLKKLISGNISTKSLGGPITIAKVAGDSADAGWQTFLQFIAMMSVMLAVMNLLPIPMLDGGHMLFYTIEAIKGSPLSLAVQGVAMRIGMTAIFGVMILALYNDFGRL